MTDGRIVEQLRRYFFGCPYPVALAYLFGSHVKGSTTPLSDVDVAVLVREADPEKQADIYLALLSDLIALFKTDRVDLTLLREEGEEGLKAVVEGTLIYAADEAERVRFERTAMSRYLEYVELTETYRRYVRKRIEDKRMGQGGLEMIDRHAVEERLSFIDAMLHRLKGYRDLSFEQFSQDETRCHAALYELQTTLEAVTDIGNHLIAALGLRKPQERAEIVAILAENGIIPQPLAERLRQAVGLRNLLVHGYLRIALDMVHRIIQERLGDIEEFCQAVITLLEQQGPPSPTPPS